MSFMRAPVMGRFDQNGNLVGFEDFAGQLADGAGGFEGNFAAAIVGAAGQIAVPAIGGAGVWHPWSCPAFAAGTAATIQNQIPAPAPFVGARLIYENGTTTVSTLTSAKVASPATSGVDGAALTWAAATFSGASSVALPVSVGAEPANTKTPVRSDYVSIVAANPALPLLMVRSQFATSGCAMNPQAGELAAFNAETGLTYLSGFTVGGGAVLDTTGIAMSTGQLICPAGVQFFYDRPAITVACVGGSTLRGQGSSGNAVGLVYRSCRDLTNSARVVSPYIAAFSSQNSVTSALATLPAMISVVRPEIVLMLAGSGNDSDLSAAGFAAMKGRMWEAADTCRRNGAIPVFCTLAPAALAAPEEALRRAQNDWLRALAAYVPVVDIALAVENPADIRLLLPAYDSGDGVHFNNAGHIAASVQLTTRLSSLLDLLL